MTSKESKYSYLFFMNNKKNLLIIFSNFIFLRLDFNIQMRKLISKTSNVFTRHPRRGCLRILHVRAYTRREESKSVPLETPVRKHYS